jgi:hypothetical protein
MENIDFFKLMNKYQHEEVKGIYFVKSKINYSDIFLFSKIIIKSNEFLIFTPIREMDEIKIELKSKYTFPVNKKIIEYEKYNGQKIFDVKKCVNHMGCFDQYSIAFGSFNTSFSIICEIGLLGIYESKPLILE